MYKVSANKCLYEKKQNKKAQHAKMRYEYTVVIFPCFSKMSSLRIELDTWRSLVSS